jgi:hypothetical protein
MGFRFDRRPPEINPFAAVREGAAAAEQGADDATDFAGDQLSRGLPSLHRLEKNFARDGRFGGESGTTTEEHQQANRDQIKDTVSDGVLLAQDAATTAQGQADAAADEARRRLADGMDAVPSAETVNQGFADAGQGVSDVSNRFQDSVASDGRVGGEPGTTNEEHQQANRDQISDGVSGAGQNALAVIARIQRLFVDARNTRTPDAMISALETARSLGGQIAEDASAWTAAVDDAIQAWIEVKVKAPAGKPNVGFPDVMKTQVGQVTVPIPYPDPAALDAAAATVRGGLSAAGDGAQQVGADVQTGVEGALGFFGEQISIFGDRGVENANTARGRMSDLSGELNDLREQDRENDSEDTAAAEAQAAEAAAAAQAQAEAAAAAAAAAAQAAKDEADRLAREEAARLAEEARKAQEELDRQAQNAGDTAQEGGEAASSWVGGLFD